MSIGLHEKPVGWNAMGQIKVRLLMEQLQNLVVGSREEPNGLRKKFGENPHTKWDNYFSGDLIMDWLGTNYSSATMTCQHDSLPFNAPGE
jgi:hypothetical protein